MRTQLPTTESNINFSLWRRYNDADIKCLFEKGLSLNINRLSFNSNNFFWFSLVSNKTAK